MKRNHVISVIGLGYVGLSIAAAFAKKYKTIGFDINQKRISELKKGLDRNLELNKADLQDIKINFSSNPDVLKKANFHIITVPTPTGNVNRPLFQMLSQASETIAKYIKKGDIVVFESTVYPGLTEEFCIPLLEKISKKKHDVDFYVGYSPERINPGDLKHPFSKIRKVVSCNNENALSIISDVYQSVLEEPVHKASSIKVAEAAKVIENTQRDVNIALINELAKICALLEISTKDVLAAAKTKWNFLDFKPGLVGGHCISVDPYYLAYKSEQLGFIPEIILSSRRTNEGMGKFIVQESIQRMIQLGIDVTRARVTILGFTYKEDCPDIRNTKVADLIKELENYKIKASIYDPLAHKDEVKHEYGYEIHSDLPRTPAHCLVIAVNHKPYRDLTIKQLKKMLHKDGLLIDIKSCFDQNELRNAGIHFYSL